MSSNNRLTQNPKRKGSRKLKMWANHSQFVVIELFRSEPTKKSFKNRDNSKSRVKMHC